MYGTIGHLLLVVALIASAVSGGAYFLSVRSPRLLPRYRSGRSPETTSSLRSGRSERSGAWPSLGRASWGVVGLTTVGAFVLLTYLFFTHQYQYAYVYQHASNDLPWYLLLSGVWEGQEGSFLLWIVYTSLVGGGVVAWSAPEYERPVMTVVAICQFFLVSMIVGLPLGPIEIGASPFSGLAEAFPGAAIFQTNPDFVPADGTGLNPLLESIWIASHPTTLFLGFALLTVPFGYAVAALWKRKYTQWVRPALPWLLGGILTLGLSIALGGYWAYVTLSFGGYWAWDPVENASLVPWLVGVAALHAMLVQKKSGRAHKAALVLTLLTFLLALYESFLTRSGILSEVSVHSFTDLGLYNQLLGWMGGMGVVGFGLFAWRYRELPTPERESHLLSREFLMFSGVVLLAAMATVIIVGTSAPILGQLFRDRPSAVPVQFYNSWTLPLAVGVAFLAGLGQLFWWNKMSVEQVNRALLKPIALAVASTAVVLLATPFVTRTIRVGAAAGRPSQVGAGVAGGIGSLWTVYGQSLLLLLLVFVAFFALYGNGFVLWRIARGNPRMMGGALSHVGLAIVLLGIVGSSGLSDPLGGRAPGGTERDYFVLHEGEARRAEGYEFRYVGKERAENDRTAYRLAVTSPQGRSFTVEPVAYKSGDQWIQHPGLERFFATDLYVSVSPRAMQVDLQSEDKVGSGSSRKGGEITMSKGDSTVVGGDQFAIEFVGFDKQVSSDRVPDSTRFAVAAVLNVTRLPDRATRRLRPVYLVKQDGSQRAIQNRIPDWGVGISFTGVNVDTGKIHLAIEGVKVASKDWVVVQATVKPFVNVFWLGILILTGGFLVALVRRVQDLRFWRDRGA